MKTRVLSLLIASFFSCLTFAQQGTIVIIKDAQPDSSQVFGFRMDHPHPERFYLDDNLDPSYSNTQTFKVSSNGSYVVTEDFTPGWQLESINCVETADQNTITHIWNRQAIIKVEPDETVACVFVNRRLGPTSAPVMISGRVHDQNGRAISNSQITVTNLVNGKTLIGRSNQFGFYSVSGIEIGGFVEIRVNAKGRQFLPVHINIMDDIEGLDFIPIDEIKKTYR